MRPCPFRSGHLEMERRLTLPPKRGEAQLVGAAERDPGGDVCEGATTAGLEGWRRGREGDGEEEGRCLLIAGVERERESREMV